MTRRTRLALAGVLTTAFVVIVGAVRANAIPEPQVPLAAADTPTREWTVIYYGIADNDLETALMSDVLEMRSVEFGPEVTLYGLIDRNTEDYSRPFPDGSFVPDADLAELGDFTGAKAFVARDGQLIEMADLGEIDMGHPNTLAWFVSEVMRVAPAERTALIMSDHGFGPLGIGPDYSTVRGEYMGQSQAGDPAAKEALEAADIARSLQLGLRGEKLDLLAFDACLMANLDMARVLSQYADYLVASIDLVPALGFDYRALEVLARQPTLGPRELGQALIDSFGQFYSTIPGSDPVTLAMFDLQAIDRLDDATATLARALATTDSQSAFGAAVQASGSQVALTPSDGTLMVDLGDLARRLAQPGAPDPVRIAADAVFGAVESSVVYQYRGPGRADSTGISITTFPEPGIARYRADLPPYWVQWMNDFYGGAIPLPPSVTDVWTTSEASLEVTESGVLVSGQLRPDVVASGAVVGATALFGAPVGGGGVEVAVRFPAQLNSGAVGAVAAAWGLTSFVMADGTVNVRPTVELEQNSEGLTGTIIGTLASDVVGSRVAALRFGVDPSTGRPGETAVFIQQGNGAWSQHSVAPGDRFVADVQEVVADGSEIILVPAPAIALDRLELRANRQNTGAFAAAVGALAADGSIVALTAQGELP